MVKWMDRKILNSQLSILKLFPINRRRSHRKKKKRKKDIKLVAKCKFDQLDRSFAKCWPSPHTHTPHAVYLPHTGKKKKSIHITCRVVRTQRLQLKKERGQRTKGSKTGKPQRNRKWAPQNCQQSHQLYCPPGGVSKSLPPVPHHLARATKVDPTTQRVTFTTSLLLDSSVRLRGAGLQRAPIASHVADMLSLTGRYFTASQVNLATHGNSNLNFRDRPI